MNEFQNWLRLHKVYCQEPLGWELKYHLLLFLIANILHFSYLTGFCGQA